MRFAGFEFRPTLYPSIAFALLFPALLALGFWQLHRAVEKQTLLDDEASRQAHVTLDLNRVAAVDTADRFRSVRASGRYLGDRHWLLDNRVFRGQPGYHVFSLFALDGAAHPLLLVDRGWVSLGPSRDLLPPVDVPTGVVTLNGRFDNPPSVGLKLDSGDLAGLAPVTVQQHLDIAELAAALGADLFPYALVLDADQPGAYQRDWQMAGSTMTPERHLGYAVQWFGLAVALLIIYLGVNTRRANELPDERHPAS